MRSCARTHPARAHQRGRYAIVTERWRGLRWTLRRQCGETRADENAAAYGEVVWSWRRDPGVKLCAKSHMATVAKKAASPGRARKKPSNHCAGKAGLFWLNL